MWDNSVVYDWWIAWDGLVVFVACYDVYHVAIAGERRSIVTRSENYSHMCRPTTMKSVNPLISKCETNSM